MITLPNITTAIKTDFTGIYVVDLYKDNGASAAWNDVTGGTIVAVTLEVRKNCQSCNCDDDTTPLYSATITTGNAVDMGNDIWHFLIEADDIAEGDAGDVISDGIYTITVTWELTVGGDTVYQSSQTCAAIINTTKCAALEVLVNDISNNSLVAIIQSIEYAITCNDCCKACKLYSELEDTLENTNCKTC